MLRAGGGCRYGWRGDRSRSLEGVAWIAWSCESGRLDDDDDNDNDDGKRPP